MSFNGMKSRRGL